MFNHAVMFIIENNENGKIILWKNLEFVIFRI